MSMWEPFREEGTRAIVAAQTAAQELGHAYIAPEHMLIGLATEWRTPAAQILSEYGATYEKLYDRVRIAIPPETQKTPQEMVFTTRAKRSIEFAFQEARHLDHNYIGVEHLLLGIAHEAQGRTDSVLQAFGLDYDVLRGKLVDRIPRYSEPNQVPFTAYDHVQIAMPAGAEDRAREFYVDALGMEEVRKPAELATRGGVWFSSGPLQLHLGVAENFQPATKAHPALRCRDYEALIAQLHERGVEVRETERLSDGRRRAFVADPFGNRIELLS